MDLDWGGIRATAIALKSVNAAALQVGSHLPPAEQNRLRERINKRALRERWMANAQALAVSAPAIARPLSAPPQSGADALQSILNERKQNTKLHLSKYVQDASKQAADSDGNHKLSRSTKDIADIMSKVWPEQPNSGAGGIHIGVLTGQVAIQYTSQD